MFSIKFLSVLLGVLALSSCELNNYTDITDSIKP